MKTYTLRHDDTYWECKIEIDLKKAEKPIREMVDFWGGSEERLQDNDGSYLHTFLKQIANEIHRIVHSTNYNTYGVIQIFASPNKEGWTLMDGSSGIKIIDVDDPYFTDDQFNIIENS
ncbi:MAG: DUF2528 family protein [Balneola sp.]